MNTKTEAPVTPRPVTDEQIDALVHEHYERVFNLAYRLTGNKADAEDLAQDTFVRALRALERYEAGNMGGWLSRITTNLFLDHVRRKRRIAFDAFPEGLAELMRGPVSAEPAEAVEMLGVDDEIRKALMALKPGVRAAVVLCDMQDMTYEEISETLGVKLGTVRSRIHRGRAALRESLAHRRVGSAAAQVAVAGAQ